MGLLFKTPRADGRWQVRASGGERGQGVAKRPCSPSHARRAGCFVTSCPARRKDAQGVAVLLVRGPGHGWQAHPVGGCLVVLPPGRGAGGAVVPGWG